MIKLFRGKVIGVNQRLLGPEPKWVTFSTVQCHGPNEEVITVEVVGNHKLGTIARVEVTIFTEQD